MADKIRVLTVANLVPRKRIELCLDACRRLVRNGYDVKWVIVGDGEWKDKLKSMAVLDLVFLDRVKSLRNLYEWADVFVLPSYDEAFGMVYIESIICGTPVVCAAREGGEEIVRHTGGGRVVECGGVGAANKICDAVVALWRDNPVDEHTKKHAKWMVDPAGIKKDWMEVQAAVR
jgi:glycosyltransferase involved in cell wall biosynthesis